MCAHTHSRQNPHSNPFSNLSYTIHGLFRWPSVHVCTRGLRQTGNLYIRLQKYIRKFCAPQFFTEVCNIHVLSKPGMHLNLATVLSDQQHIIQHSSKLSGSLAWRGERFLNVLLFSSVTCTLLLVLLRNSLLMPFSHKKKSVPPSFVPLPFHPSVA